MTLAAALLLAAIPTAQSCPVDHAHYVLRGSPGITIDFRPVDSGPDWPSGLALKVHSDYANETTWWVPWNGGSDLQQHLASTTAVTALDWHPPDPDDGPRPLGDRPLLVFDSQYNIQSAVPKRGDIAPAHLLVPDAGGSQDHAFPIRQFFDLERC